MGRVQVNRVEKVLTSSWQTLETITKKCGYKSKHSTIRAIHEMGSSIERKYAGQRQKGTCSVYRLRPLPKEYKIALRWYWPCGVLKSEWHQCFSKDKCYLYKRGRCKI